METPVNLQPQIPNNGTPSYVIPDYVLDDLCSRFIINIPEEERQDRIRIFFQIELAHWFYLDFYCAEDNELRTLLFKHCPFLKIHGEEVDKILEDWKNYKMSVPTYGAIMLDPEHKYCLLVQGFWTKSSWGFPKGKVNAEEQACNCAVREVLEETGFDIGNLINTNEYLENYLNGQLTRLYIVPGVPLQTKFLPKTRNEIKSLQWFPVEALPAHKRDLIPKTQLKMNPNNFFMVIPFVKPLRKWIMNKSKPDKTLVDSKKISDNNGQYKQSCENSDVRPTREKIKMKQRQYFAQQNQNEFQEFLNLKEPKSKSGETNNRAESPRKASGRSDSPRKEPYQQRQQRHQEGRSPRQSANSNRRYQILNRDGSLAGPVVGATRRSLANQFEQGQQPQPSSGQVNKKPQSPAVQNMSSATQKTSNPKSSKREECKVPNLGGAEPSKQLPGDEMCSQTWLNFKFDVGAIMACLP
ncbi:hypothetical protein ScPMuIL_018428 [Solemya velum]